MIALIQRVTQATVAVNGKTIGAIDNGLLALIGIEKTDNWEKAEKLAQKILSYRIFSDTNNKMNLNIQQTGGGLLLVSQFTLAANTSKGNRPGFDPAMPPAEAAIFFERFCTHLQTLHPQIATGQFGAHMQISLTNDGPVTFWLQV